MKNTISVTEAVRNFAEFINRAAYRGENFLLKRGGRPVARLIRVPRAGRLGDLPELLAAVSRPIPEEGEAMARDLAEASREISALPEVDPWES